MKRREFIKILSSSVPLVLCGCSTPFQHFLKTFENKKSDSESALEDLATKKSSVSSEVRMHGDHHDKIAHFDADFKDDVFFGPEKIVVMKSLVDKFRAVQARVGHGNFNLLGIDEFFFHAGFTKFGAVTPEEKLFLEELFFFDAKKYGFYGEKNFQTFTENLDKRDIIKVPYTGHFLRKGKSLETYEQIKKDVGDGVILTSGVRALAKQFHLFLEKGLASEGNMSKASRSLAPPGYSFHGKEDFDVGRIGFGPKNFTDDFAQTSEFQLLQKLGYVEIRYTETNSLGVRFEPWHIKI